MSDAPTLAIIIVSFNVRDELDACLRAVVGLTGPIDASVTVVDNGSRDGTVDMLRERWPDVQLIETGSNLGFARANNAGIRATPGAYVLLLNPDTIARPGAIVTLVQALAGHPDAAAAGARLVDAQGRPELSFGWSMSPLGEVRQKAIGMLYARELDSIVRMVDRWTRTPGTRDWVSGACLLVRRADLDAVGLLDERYFMYAEDVDLCVALRKRGRTILFVPSAEIVHLRGRSVGRSPGSEALRRQSQLAYYEKHHPAYVPLLKLYLGLTGRKSSAEARNDSR